MRKSLDLTARVKAFHTNTIGRTVLVSTLLCVLCTSGESISAVAYAIDDFQAGPLAPRLEYPGDSFKADGKTNLIKIRIGAKGYIIEAGSKFTIYSNGWVITVNDIIMNTGQEVINMHSLRLNKNDCARMIKSESTGSYKLEKVDNNSTGTELPRLPRHGKGVTTSSKTNKLNPKDAAGYVKRGNAYYRSRQHNRAISHYSKAIELDPEYAAAYYNRGNAYASLKKFDQAKVDLLKAVELNPALKSNVKKSCDIYKLDLKLDVESGMVIPLSEFAELGEQDTREKSQQRSFAYPSSNKTGLWIGSIPRGGGVYVRKIDPEDPNASSNWINVGFTPIFLENLEPGHYEVNVVYLQQIPYERYVNLDYRKTEKIAGKMMNAIVARRCVDDGTLWGAPIFDIKVSKEKLATVCALIYDVTLSIDKILPLYPKGDNFRCKFEDNKVLDLFCGEKCGLKRPLAEKALEALKRGGVFVTPNDQRDIIPLQRAHFTPDKELITLVPIGKLVDGKVVLDSITVPKLENIGSLESLPRFEHPLQGSNEVKIQNPNTFAVTVALRSGKGGKDFQVPPNSSNSAFVPDGNYDIYFVYSNQSDALFQGDSFSLHANGVEIQIVKVIDGNYEIRRVK